MSSFLDNLLWRRAVKSFTGEPVDAAPILKAIHNAPSSFGLQPFKVVVVSNKALKERLQPVSYNQSQVSECDSLLVFCARNDCLERVDEFVKATGAEGYRGMMEGFVKSVPDQGAWAARQAYLALGFALAAAAELKIDSCPMEGFDPEQVHTILELDDTLVPVVYLALGKASGPVQTPRFRFPVDDLFLVRT